MCAVPYRLYKYLSWGGTAVAIRKNRRRSCSFFDNDSSHHGCKYSHIFVLLCCSRHEYFYVAIKTRLTIILVFFLSIQRLAVSSWPCSSARLFWMARWVFMFYQNWVTCDCNQASGKTKECEKTERFVIVPSII